MKKKVAILFSAIFGTMLLAGCEEQTYNFGEKVLPESQVEEMLSDMLEIENPGMDINVDISEEVD